MNGLSIFLYIVSIIMWWAGFNYAATRTESPTRRKLLSTAAAFALAWPAAFIALAAALATKLAANIMIAIGDHINNTWDAAVSDPDDNTITVLTPTLTAMRIQRENTEHGDTETAAKEETRTALADNMPLMPPPPPPTAQNTESDTASQSGAGDDAETSDNADSADDKGSDNDDETVTIQKVTLSDII